MPIWDGEDELAAGERYPNLEPHRGDVTLPDHCPRVVCAEFSPYGRLRDTPWPTALRALDEAGRLYTLSHYDGRFRVVRADDRHVQVLVDRPCGASQQSANDVREMLLMARDVLDPAPLRAGESCRCGAGMLPAVGPRTCPRCERTERSPVPVGTLSPLMSGGRPHRLVAGGREVPVPPDYEYAWTAHLENDQSLTLLFVEGHLVLARRPDGPHDHQDLEAVAWYAAGDDLDDEALSRDPMLPLEYFAVDGASLSQWTERFDLDGLRCRSCSRFRPTARARCPHCQHRPADPPVRPNRLGGRGKVALVWIGECDDNPVFYLHCALGADGAEYRISYRFGWLSVVRHAEGGPAEGEVLIDRRQGGAFDSAGSSDELLALTGDVFTLNREGVPCCCGAVYPEAQVPDTCYRCSSALMTR